MSDISEWDEKIDTVLFAYRVLKNKSTGYSPYFMMYHRQPRLPIDVEFLPNHSLEDENVEEFVQLRKGGKLTERFKGPYIIRRCLDKGVYELETKDGKVLKTKHNMNRLKVL